MYQEAIRIRTLKLGSDDRDVGVATALLGALLLARGRTAEALPKLQEATRILGGHDAWARILANYIQVVLLVKNREFDKALAPQERILNDVRKLMGESHPFAIMLLSERAGLLRDTGRIEEAEKTIRKTLASFASRADWRSFSAIARCRWSRGFGVPQPRPPC